MAVPGDVTVAQNGGQGNAKLHPYLVTLVRWCVSCVWGTATVFLHRLMTAPLPPITASKPSPKPRPASSDHLHPEPRVDCVVLHEPATTLWNVDVIFVHGLYGSLGNTWRQGDWRSRYKLDPTRVPLRDHTTINCNCETPDPIYNDLNEIYSYETTINEQVTFNNINERLKRILPNENSLITEKFYNNTLEILDNYDTQAKFVEDLFKNENRKCNENKCHSKNELNDKVNHVNGIKCNVNGIKCNIDCVTQCKCSDGCGVGCGCVCDDCYSTCWPRDWIKEDFPGARVISINYTSDPYLWRPLWVKESKRLRLHERAGQMIEQLLSLRVGQRPIIWVGHSKGGLFIKQIYCEAYEAYSKINKNTTKNDIEISKNNENRPNNDVYEIECEKMNLLLNDRINAKNDIVINKNDTEFNENTVYDNINTMNCTENCEDINESLENVINKDCNLNLNNDKEACDKNDNVLAKDVSNDMIINVRNDEQHISNEIHDKGLMKSPNSEMIRNNMSSSCKEDTQDLETSSLWCNSVGFMFYSVPHRGSPLATIKTPITARSIELLEIAKDCPLVLDLQDRWLIATESSRPQVRSLVETCRTLMSVLWLRIVSVDSADAGVGSLHGVSVDHREICKPSSRNCLLYKELKELIRNSLRKCGCH